MKKAKWLGHPPDFQMITVNTVGAFFNRHYNGLQLTTNNRQIQGGTNGAQGFIILHEVAHVARVLEHDRGNQGAVNRNDKKLSSHCKRTIGAL